MDQSGDSVDHEPAVAENCSEVEEKGVKQRGDFVDSEQNVPKRHFSELEDDANQNEESVDHGQVAKRHCSEVEEKNVNICGGSVGNGQVIEKNELDELEEKGKSVESADDGHVQTKNDESSDEKGLNQSVDSGEHGQVVAKHYNELEEKGLNARTKSRILYMRNFNNWIKSMTINEIVEKFRRAQVNDITILDMCCGKGGDILKWMKTKMTRHVVFVDIAENSVQQCKERYDNIEAGSRNDRNHRNRGNPPFSAEFYTADCTKVRLRSVYKSPDIRFDLVSVQFSFHYCFETLPQAQMMLKNISENLKPGGFFIGTTTNSSRIVKRFRKSGSKEFGNEIYRIDVETPEPFPLFGAKYNFQLDDVVNNCPEFLVNFPTFVKLAEEKYGLKLVFKHTFDKYFHLKLQDGHFLLERMQALESYPQFDGESLSSDKDEDYIHAKRFKEETPDCRRFGTLSKSEWEAVSLYVAFAFVKVG